MQIEKVPQTEAAHLLANTYGGFLKGRRDPNWISRIEVLTEAVIKRLQKAQLVRENQGSLQLTLLGDAVGKSSLKLDSALLLIDLLQNLDQTLITPINLVALLQILPELDGTSFPFRKGPAENVRVQQAAQRFSNSVVRELQGNAADMSDYLKRCKKAAVLFDWIEGQAIEVIERSYTTNPFTAVGRGSVQGLADITRYHLRSTAEILLLVSPSSAVNQNDLDDLMTQLEFGLPKSALPLLQLPVRLDRGAALTLFNAGIRSSSDVFSTDHETIERLLGSELADAIATHRTS